MAFKSIRTLLEFGDLLDDWGTNLLRAYELTSRDHRLRQRYEKQLCLKSTGLARTLGPALIRGVALTGSDLYVREGTDVTVIFQVTNRALFLAAVEPFLDEARKEFKGRLKEKRTKYRGATIESFTTPLREVSLHRAAVGDYVIYSNSPVGLRRVLDVHSKRKYSLAQSRDFQYMRTVFRHDDKQEDGFAYLSDAFIRQLVGPASKIKEKRRLEALTSLAMVTNGALFAAWESGRLPADHEALLTTCGLKRQELYVPEGKGVEWDGRQRGALSEAYNTMHFATPLIELPIDQVTKQEADDYAAFREGYLTNWRKYFDPVGMRFALRDRQVRVETYILPLITNSDYAQLRELIGKGTATLDVGSIPPKTLFQFTAHINPDFRFFSFPPKDALGDWLFVRWDDSRHFRGLAKLWVQRELEPDDGAERARMASRLFWQLPLTFGVRMGKEKEFDKVLADAQRHLDSNTAPRSREIIKPLYKGIPITRTRFDAGYFGPDPNRPGTPKDKRFQMTWYHAKVGGAWYLSFNLDSLRAVIDRAVARRDGKREKDEVKINSSLYLAPEAALGAAGALRSYLEWETFRRAVANGPLWEVLYRTGVTEKLDPEEKPGVALHYLGFVPVSPDGAPYDYRRRTGLVSNTRHGSRGQPRLHDDLAETSPVARLLAQLRTIRADLRFREDGVHTVLTIQRHKAGPK